MFVCLVVVTAVTVLADGGRDDSSRVSSENVGWNWWDGLRLDLFEQYSTAWMRSVAPPDGGADWPKLEMNARVVAAVILGSLGACICAAGGVGGGGLFIPIFNLLLLFDAKTSAALSNIMILAGSIAVLAWNIRRTHPLSPGKPLIDYDVALLLNPNMLLGISIGVFCNITFPGWLLISVLTVILFYMTNRSIQNGFTRWKKESAAAAKAKEKIAIVSAHSVETGQRTSGLTEPLLGGQSEPSLFAQCPPQKLIKLVMMWLLFFAVQILRGGEGTEGILKVKPCGLAYWLLSASQLPLAIGLTAWIALQHSSKSHAAKPSESNEEVDVMLTSRAYTVFPLMALLAGMLGGMLGIGGGMIINPMLTEVGMHPQATAGTSSFMIFFATSMSVLQFWLLGRIPMDFALLFGAVCLFWSCVGIGLLQAAIVKHGRPSVIVFLVSSVMGVSALLMATFGGFNVWHQYRAGDYMGFHAACGEK